MTEATPDPELPSAIALAWGVAASPQRGPKRELSIERIVEAAIAIADQGGLGAVSMSAVATRLGYTPMSLYRYVTSKDDLVTLMQEHGVGVPPESLSEAHGWRDALQEYRRASIETYRRHPWLLDIPVAGSPATPNNLAWLDAMLGAFDGTPLDRFEQVAISLAVLAHTRWQGTVERSYEDEAARAGHSTDDVDRTVSALLDALVTAEQFPNVRDALDAEVFAPGDADPFGYGFERLLDGIERHMAASDRPAAPTREHGEAPAVLADKRVKEAAKARREAEKLLRDARKREREALKVARERAARDAAKA